MKRLLVILILALVLLPLASTALAAGGAGPSKDLMKGVFLEVNEINHTVVFKKDGAEETRILVLKSDMVAQDVPINKKVMLNLDKEAGENIIKDYSRMFLDMTLKNVISLIAVGLIGGLLSGFIGSGGAFVLTPAMMSLGVPGAVAVASNMCHKFPKAMVGTYKRWKYGQVDIKLALTMAVTAIIGVQIGIKIQKIILANWGNAGSNLYVSAVFVVILVVVGGYVFLDARKVAKEGDDTGHKTSNLALRLQQINLPPMMHFKVAKVRISAWITIPVGLATGMLAATIAVGGFIGVPGMIYVIGASAMVASATELGIAFIMGCWGSIQWGLSGLIDIRLSLLLLSASLIGVQLGALGTTYVKDYIIKIVMASVMLIVAVSRGFLIPGYLSDVGLRAPMDPGLAHLFEQISYWSLVTALITSAAIITASMITGISKARKEERALAREAMHV